MHRRACLAIDLKSFFASVECVERGLDPLTTNLVVADLSRTEKTICLAVTPSLKAYGIPGRARLFEVVQKVKEVNAQRCISAPNRTLTGESSDANVLKASPGTALSYIVAPPRMAKYMSYSSRIYEIYLKYVAPEDIHVYSIDEVLMDVTAYLDAMGLTARELAMKMILDVLKETGITATAGIGTNLYLCKIAMDIGAKHVAPDANGVRIAELNEITYREQLWTHKPLTDFWRVGRGYAKKLEANGLHTMGDVARCSLGGPGNYYNEDLLYKLFGINAELLIDHAWGWEPCTMAQIKAFRPSTNSVGSGQVLQCPYPYEKTRLIVREMAELLALDLVDKKLVTDQVALLIGYDIENLNTPEKRAAYKGKVESDGYGRSIPKSAHGSANLPRQTSSARQIVTAFMEIFDRVIDHDLTVRRVGVTANRVIGEELAKHSSGPEQLDMFTDYEAAAEQKEREDKELARERSLQEAALALKKRYGKNAIFKGLNLLDGATTIARNGQIGGHKE